MNLIKTWFVLLLLLLFLSLPQFLYAGGDMPENILYIKIYPENNKIYGVSRISVPSGTLSKIDISGIKVLSASINNKPFKVKDTEQALSFKPENSDDILSIEFEAVFSSMPDVNSDNHGVVQGNLINTECIYLINNWYPVIQGLARHNLTAVIPAGFEAISEAEETSVKDIANRTREFSFIFNHPLKGISLIAGRYMIEKEIHNNTEIYTYFLPEEKDLAKTYILKSKDFLDKYEKLIGKYPYRRFSIVENILPTGYSMPTFTLLGRDIIKLPFIVETSLGHEILHQWFGNLVFVDDSSGNWAEGLTTYLSDHLYEEMKGTGYIYRKDLLLSFQNYINTDNEYALKEFKGKTNRISSAIGYGKSAMIFHMLKELTGGDSFYKALRSFIENNSFKIASWDDIKKSFHDISGKDFGWFFKQWVDEKGIIEIDVKDIYTRYSGSKSYISFSIIQKRKTFKFRLPVTVRLREGEVRKNIEIEKEKTHVEIETNGQPVELVIDDNYDLFRKLAEKESPPVISRMLGDRKKIFVIPKGRKEDYSTLSAFLKKEGLIEKREEDLTNEDISSSSLFVPDIETDLLKRLFGKQEKIPEETHMIVRENPFNRKSVVTIVSSHSLDETIRYITKITHYGKFSRLVFKNGKNIIKETNESDRGMRNIIESDTFGVEIPRSINISEVIEKTSNKKIIYIGETHDRLEHHRVQLEVIRALHNKGKKVAIGMEMFQKPFQKVIDDFIEGLIDEKEFLKKSEYFKRWGFDYSLYREILLYAREFKIPVIALNIRKEITSKVAKGGILSLSEDELREVPEDMDMSDIQYRKRLMAIFEKHSTANEKNFDFFFQAQVLWDESMAHNLDDFLRKNPDYQIVVIAGSGHIAYGSGIPKRAYRLNRLDFSIIMNGQDAEIDIADFMLYPAPVNYQESPKLMVMFREEDGKVSVTGFAPESISEKAGMKKGDVVLAIDEAKVDSIEDIKIALFFKKKGDEITIKVLRKRFLMGHSEKILKIRL